MTERSHLQFFLLANPTAQMDSEHKFDSAEMVDHDDIKNGECTGT